ncbi:glycolate oxidase iron-sulfur subunit [Evansella caseinilytica]|uniref:Glycolate oxidase iron-sulfur subunit n=1 Tax=Evansella caseinilytica TaxID=1503961 RepID=A0A1H3KD59_9BACI|nr:(Fe-S)-binding protein [Evansella caseinilytica]SDY50071.1 glycolate oxidase iron-sulfur subunit [Evansella caseinilytica]
MTDNQTSRAAELTKQFQDRLDYDELLNCMRCGFCLPACPTYRETKGNEAASPRGRIAMMKAVVDGVYEPDEDFENQLSLCLGCRACEPACPSGVKYGHLLEEATDILQASKQPSALVRATRWFIFTHLFPKRRQMRRAAGLLWLYQKSGLQTLSRATRLTRLAGKQLSALERVLPKLPSPKWLNNRPTHLVPQGGATVKKKVAFFSGCMMDTIFVATNDATLFLLQRVGCEVFIPAGQSCCGALHAHSGEKVKAKELAKQNIAAFEKREIDWIVSNAGGCGAILTEYDDLLKEEPGWHERAQEFVKKVRDISEILLETGLPEMELPPQTVTYQDSCHLRNVMKTVAAPRKLIQAIKGVTFVEMNEADRCCGSAGTYNIVEQAMSMQILDEKMKNVKETKAATIVTANPGCLLQMKLGIEREGLTDSLCGTHIADLLAEAVKYRDEHSSSQVD